MKRDAEQMQKGAAQVAAMFARHGPAYRWWVVVTVMTGTFAAVMETTIVNIALPEIIRAFAVGHDRVQLLSTGFLAAMTASMLVSGWAIARFGQRSTFSTALWLLIAFSALAALTRPAHFELLALWRIGQGAVAGLIQPLAMVALVDVFPPGQRGRAMSAYGLGIVLSPALGPVMGGLLVDHFGWRAVFLVTIPFCLAALMLAPRYLVQGRSARGARRALDLVGLALLCGALVTLLSGLSAVFDARAPVWLGLVLAGTLLSVAFVLWERRVAEPLLDLRMLGRPSFAAAILVTAIYGMGLYGSVYLFPLFAQDVAGFSAFDSGLMLVPGGVVLALVLVVSGRLTDRSSPHRVVLAGLACFAVSAALMAATARQAGFWLIAAWVALGRVGLGLIIPGLNAGALKLVAPGSEAAGAAAINFFRQAGGALGVTLLALFLEWRQRVYGEPTAGATGWLRASGGFAESFALVALIYAWALIPARRMTDATLTRRP